MKKLILGLAVLMSILPAAPRATAQVKFSSPSIGGTVPSGLALPTAITMLPELHFSAVLWIDGFGHDANSTDFQIWKTLAFDFSTFTPGAHVFYWVFDYTDTYGPYPFLVSYPVPTLTSLSPASVLQGSTGIYLTVTGTKFTRDSTIQWNGYTLITSYNSATSLEASLPDALLASAGTPKVTVFNPPPGGGTSTSLTFTINNPVPTLTSISPTSVVKGSAGFTLTVTGTKFNTQSKVLWNGVALTTTYVSATSLKAAVPAANVLNSGTATVTVNNPAPGGGTTAGKTFTIIQ